MGPGERLWCQPRACPGPEDPGLEETRSSLGRALHARWRSTGPSVAMLAFFCPYPSQPGDVPRSRLGFKTRRFVASNSPCCHFPCAVFSMSGTNSKWPDGSVCSRLGSKISRKPKVSGDRDSLLLRDFSERVAVLFFPVEPWRLQPFGVPKGGPTGRAGARRPTVQYCEVSRRLLCHHHPDG